MSKRLTCTEKWNKIWFRKLSPENKLFWLFICDNCNHAGIWNVDYEIASIYIGKKINESALKIAFLGKIYYFDNDNKIFIPSFIEFQYGELNPKNRVHLSVLNALKKNNLYNILQEIKEGANKPLASPLLGAKDKDKDKDKDINISLERNNPEKSEKIGKSVIDFETIWNQYPRKDGRKQALSHFNATVKTPEAFSRIQQALNNYLKSDNVKNGFIKNGSTWFNNWDDWVNIEPPKAILNKQKEAKKQSDELINLVVKPINDIADWLIDHEMPKGFKQAFIDKYGEVKGIEKYQDVLQKETQLRKEFTKGINISAVLSNIANKNGQI